jgi:D-serine deaminase-like pyridoxal phosphate-dependent protein
MDIETPAALIDRDAAWKANIDAHAKAIFRRLACACGRM